MNREHTVKLFIIIQQALVIIGIACVTLSLAQLGDASENASNQEKQTRTKEDIEKMQTEKQVSMKKLNNLESVPRAVSHMGALEGCLNYLGIEVSPSVTFFGGKTLNLYDGLSLCEKFQLSEGTCLKRKKHCQRLSSSKSEVLTYYPIVCWRGCRSK